MRATTSTETESVRRAVTASRSGYGEAAAFTLLGGSPVAGRSGCGPLEHSR
jgi:hypothetical protein